MRNKKLLLFSPFLLIASLIASAAPKAGQSAAPPASAGSGATGAQRALIDQYCVSCHNERLRTAGFTLEKADIANVAADAALWEKVLEKARTAAMPPPGLPRPDGSAYSALATYLETSLDKAAEAKLQPGRVTVHRLNRAEYTNAVRDLLGLDVDVQAMLPADDSGYGFAWLLHPRCDQPAVGRKVSILADSFSFLRTA